MKFNHFFVNGKKGTIEVHNATKKGDIVHVKATIDTHYTLYKNVECSTCFSESKGHLYLSFYTDRTKKGNEGRVLVRIDKNKKLVDYIWEQSGYGYHSNIYCWTTNYKANWCD